MESQQIIPLPWTWTYLHAGLECDWRTVAKEEDARRPQIGHGEQRFTQSNPDDEEEEEEEEEEDGERIVLTRKRRAGAQSSPPVPPKPRGTDRKRYSGGMMPVER